MISTDTPTPDHSDAPDASWAGAVAKLKVSAVPAGAVNLNVEGRQLVGPLQGFGPLWRKTYRVRLPGVEVTPAEVVRVWKDRFAELHPSSNHFFAARPGVAPGDVVLLNATIGYVPVYAGMLVLYADEESFTMMTPQGLPESGWFTCSADQREGVTIAQVQTFGRANDPIYEIGFRLVGARAQEQIWTHVLERLAAHFGVNGYVHLEKTLLDSRVQWAQAKNVWYNAGVRSIVYRLSTPARWTQARIASRWTRS